MRMTPNGSDEARGGQTMGKQTCDFASQRSSLRVCLLCVR